MNALTTITHDLVYDVVTDQNGRFVFLGEGTFYRIYLFALKHRERGSIENYILFKVQRDEYASLTPQHICNPHVDQLWIQEYENLEKLSDTPHIIHIKDIIKSENRGPLHFSPLCYCMQFRNFFHLPCPTCGGSMKNCKLDVLENVYSTSLERYIYCPNPGCKSADNKIVAYYNTESSVVGASPKIVSKNKNFPAFTLCSRESLSEHWLKDKKQFSTEAADIPCFQCTQEKILGLCPHFRIFSFYEFYAIPLQICHLPFESLIQIFSGRPMEDVKEDLVRKGWYFASFLPKNHENPSFSISKDANVPSSSQEPDGIKIDKDKNKTANTVEPDKGNKNSYDKPKDQEPEKSRHGKSKELEKIKPPDSKDVGKSNESNEQKDVIKKEVRPSGLFHFDTSTQDYVLEILYLKLSLFMDICSSVRSVHKKLGRAHMNLIPESMMVIQEEHADSAGRFNTVLFMSGLASQKDGVIPQYNLCHPYVVSPLLQEKIFHVDHAPQLNGNVSIHDTKFILAAEGCKIGIPNIFPGDYLEWTCIGTLQHKSYLGVVRKVNTAQNCLEGEIFKSPDAIWMNPEASQIVEIQEIEEAENIDEVSVQFKHYPNLGIQEDVYGLGKLLLYILFYNSKVSLAEIDSSLRQILDHLASLPTSISAQNLEKPIMGYIQSTILKQENIFYDVQDANAIVQAQLIAITDLIPKSIWHKIISLIFQMITNKYGNFSLVCKQNSDFLDEIIKQVNAILQEIQDKMFKRVSFYERSNIDDFRGFLAEELRRDMEKLSEMERTQTKTATMPSMSPDTSYMNAPSVSTLTTWDTAYKRPSHSHRSFWAKVRRWWKKRERK